MRIEILAAKPEGLILEHNHVCPWRAGPLLTVALRKLVTNPGRIAGPYLSAGMTAMDIGCGMGFFTLPMASMVGEHGKVIAVDVQQEMIDGLKKNIIKAGSQNIIPHVCDFHSLHVDQWKGTVDFALIFWMLHEVPDAERMILEIYSVLAPNGKLLFAEPIAHVGNKKFRQSLSMLNQIGFTTIDTPKIPISRAAVLQKKSDNLQG